MNDRTAVPIVVAALLRNGPATAAAYVYVVGGSTTVDFTDAAVVGKSSNLRVDISAGAVANTVRVVLLESQGTEDEVGERGRCEEGGEGREI